MKKDTVYTLLILINFIFSFLVVFDILFQINSKYTPIFFVIFLGLSFINLSIFQMESFNKKDKTFKKKNKKQKTSDDDIFAGRARTGRIFDNKEERTINKDEFENWKKNYYNSYSKPQKEKIGKEYKILNISIEEKEVLTKAKLKKKYYLLAQKFHPDNVNTGDKDKMQEINNAYQTLLKKF